MISAILLFFFEVDFMASIAVQMGGWKGSAKIVLDFLEFEIIGRVADGQTQ